MKEQTYIEAHKGGGMSFVGEDAVRLMQATVIEHALRFYAKTGMKMNRSYTPSAMLRAAAQIMGKPAYKRGQYVQAADDLKKWGQTMNAALPHVYPQTREALKDAQAQPDRTHIDVFKADDGKWAYCPSLVRASPTMHRAFTMHGSYETQREAIDAVLADATIPTNSIVNVYDEMGPNQPTTKE